MSSAEPGRPPALTAIHLPLAERVNCSALCCEVSRIPHSPPNVTRSEATTPCEPSTPVAGGAWATHIEAQVATHIAATITTAALNPDRFTHSLLSSSLSLQQRRKRQLLQLAHVPHVRKITGLFRCWHFLAGCHIDESILAPRHPAILGKGERCNARATALRHLH